MPLLGTLQCKMLTLLLSKQESNHTGCLKAEIDGPASLALELELTIC